MVNEKKHILINGELIQYNLKRSKRAHNLSLSIDCTAGVIAVKPWFVSTRTLEKFILQKQNWIFKHLDRFSKLDLKALPKSSKTFYKKYKEEIKIDAIKILEKYNKFYNFTYNKISIKNQKTRWGSCSIKNNLNLNYRIKLLPQKLKEYIVVHELCHLKEFNHSKNFWKLIEKTIPDYKNIKKELKKYSLH